MIISVQIKFVLENYRCSDAQMGKNYGVIETQLQKQNAFSIISLLFYIY